RSSGAAAWIRSASWSIPAASRSVRWRGGRRLSPAMWRHLQAVTRLAEAAGVRGPMTMHQAILGGYGEVARELAEEAVAAVGESHFRAVLRQFSSEWFLDGHSVRVWH